MVHPLKASFESSGSVHEMEGQIPRNISEYPHI